MHQVKFLVMWNLFTYMAINTFLILIILSNFVPAFMEERSFSHISSSTAPVMFGLLVGVFSLHSHLEFYIWRVFTLLVSAIYIYDQQQLSNWPHGSPPNSAINCKSYPRGSGLPRGNLDEEGGGWMSEIRSQALGKASLGSKMDHVAPHKLSDTFYASLSHCHETWLYLWCRLQHDAPK